MYEPTENTMPVAAWVDHIGAAETAFVWDGFICNKSAHFRALSSDSRFKVAFPTSPLNRELLEKFERFLGYGFTVIEIPESWVGDYRRPSNWLDKVVNKALDRVPQQTDDESPVVYDEILAERVLTILAPKYPGPVNMLDIKHSLIEEPSDQHLLTTLQGLKLEGLIAGDAIPPSTSGRGKLQVLMKVHITKDGRQHMSGKVQRRDTDPQVVHQYNNYGQSGAMGPNSVGTFNYQSQWQMLQNDVDLSALAVEFGKAVDQQRQTASTSGDYQNLSLLAEAKDHAEKRDGSKLMETIVKMGQSAVPVLANAGAMGLVHWLEHKTGVKLS